MGERDKEVSVCKIADQGETGFPTDYNKTSVVEQSHSREHRSAYFIGNVFLSKHNEMLWVKIVLCFLFFSWNPALWWSSQNPLSSSLLAVAALLPCGEKAEGLSFYYKKRNNQTPVKFNLDSTGGMQRSLGRLLLELNYDSGFASVVGWLWLLHGRGVS